MRNTLVMEFERLRDDVHAVLGRKISRYYEMTDMPFRIFSTICSNFFFFGSR